MFKLAHTQEPVHHTSVHAVSSQDGLHLVNRTFPYFKECMHRTAQLGGGSVNGCKAAGLLGVKGHQ